MRPHWDVVQPSRFCPQACRCVWHQRVDLYPSFHPLKGALAYQYERNASWLCYKKSRGRYATYHNPGNAKQSNWQNNIWGRSFRFNGKGRVQQFHQSNWWQSLLTRFTSRKVGEEKAMHGYFTDQCALQMQPLALDSNKRSANGSAFCGLGGIAVAAFYIETKGCWLLSTSDLSIPNLCNPCMTEHGWWCWKHLIKIKFYFVIWWYNLLGKTFTLPMKIRRAKSWFGKNCISFSAHDHICAREMHLAT